MTRILAALAIGLGLVSAAAASPTQDDFATRFFAEMQRNSG